MDQAKGSTGFAVLLCCFGLLFGPLDVLQAQDAAPLQIPRLTGPITLDGFSTEPAWEAIEPWRPTQYEPDNGAQPTEKTEFRVAHDDDFLYFSLRAYDQEGEAGIRANSFYRDRLNGSDHFEIMLDTFNDNETGIIINTTPGGNRTDSAISNDASGGGIATGGWINQDFNTFWDSETQITSDGWFAEIRVPFSSLRFQNEDGKVMMGLAMQRKVARKTERLVFPSVKPVADWAFLKPSLAQKIVLEGPKPQKPVYITPYALGGFGQSHALNADGSAFEQTDDGIGEVGFDLKYGLTNNLTVDLTVNTDFAQVEADDQQVNLTRFSLFFPEKRQFFQERASIFDFRTGGLSRLFHSRRIGLTDDGQQVQLYGGVRMVGRIGTWDVGLLDMQTVDSDALPSENFGVVRVRRQAFNPYSYAGGMFTRRASAHGSHNVAYGLDGVFRLFGDDYLTLQWAQSFDDANEDAGLTNGRLTAQMERRTRIGWGYQSILAWAGRTYNPGIGFTQRNNFTLLDNTLSYTWLPGESSALIYHTLGLSGLAFLRNGDGSIESAEVGPEWDISFKSGSSVSLQAKAVYEDLLEPFALSKDAEVPVGDYTFFSAAASYKVSHTSLVQIRPSIEAGTFYDGWQSTFMIRPIWYVSPHLELGGTYQYSRVRFGGRDQEFDAHIARLRIGTALNTNLSANTFVQYNSNADAFSANIRFRYNIREGNDFWIVYNEGLNLDRRRITPILPRSDNRSIQAKYTYTFQI